MIERGDERVKGSVFLLGESVEVLRRYAPDQVHLVWTSPPYFNQREEYATYQDVDDYLDQVGLVLNECARLLKPSYVMAVNVGQDREFDLPSHMSMVMKAIGLKYIDTIEWNKGGEIGTRGVFMEKGIYYPNFSHEPIFIYQKPPLTTVTGKSLSKDNFPEFEYSDVDYITSALRTNVWDVTPARNSWHPAPFPMQLCKDIIRCYSKKGQLVLDPYGGSGTTAKAAMELGREYMLIERNLEYYSKTDAELKSFNPGLGLL